MLQPFAKGDEGVYRIYDVRLFVDIGNSVAEGLELLDQTCIHLIAGDSSIEEFVDGEQNFIGQLRAGDILGCT